MNRLSTIAILILVLLLLGGGTFWYFAYGVGAEPPGRARLPGLSAPVEIAWHEDGYASIEAETLQDEYTALGYVHGMKRAWPMVLWRETALGKLGTHFGEELLLLDRFTRQLGFATLARETYEQMPEEERALLEAYATGVNAALQSDAVRVQAPFPILNFDPEGWEPFHTLALERLLAWTATPPLAENQQLARLAGPSADSLARADSLLRHWLHLGGFDRSIAWAADGGDGARLFSRIVYGSSALPLLQSVSFIRADSSYLIGASLPGTPFFFMGMTPARAWTILPGSGYTITPAPVVRDTVGIAYERVTTADGDEHLLRIQRRAGQMRLGRVTGAGNQWRTGAGPQSPMDTATAPDTAFAAQTDTAATFVRRGANLVLRWPGLEPGSDWTAWRALMEGGAPGFTLLSGDGLVLNSGGSRRVLGNPAFTVSFAQGAAVGNSPWTPLVALRLDALASNMDSMRLSGMTPVASDTAGGWAPAGQTGSGVAAWQHDCTSAWAAGQTQQLLAAVDSVAARRSYDARMEEALTYLRNWDYAYDHVSIGASIYETWAWLVQRARGALPGFTQTSDTSYATYFQNYQRVRLLHQAVSHLTEVAGEDMSTWRWERIHSIHYGFPVWSSGLLDERDLPAESRYAPVTLPAHGHPSAPCGGTTFAAPGPEAAAAWEGWVQTDEWGAFTVQRRRFETDEFLGRYRTSTQPPPPVTFEVFGEPRSTTTLLPAE